MTKKIRNVEIAKAVCEAIPRLEFSKVLDEIDIGRGPVEENRFADKDLVKRYIDGFNEKYEEI